MKKNIIILFGLCFINVNLFGTIREVPTAYSSIQNALDTCLSGDTVLVLPGIYHENIIWPDVNGIKLFSATGPDSTFIIGMKDERVIRVNRSFFNSVKIDTSTVIRGFTISNRLNNIGDNNGGGIAIYEGGLKLENLNIENNYLTNRDFTNGAGIYFYESNSVILNCNIRYNNIDSTDRAIGAGIYLNRGSLLIYNSKISNNYSNSTSWAYGSGVYAERSFVKIKNSEICKNFGNGGPWTYGVGIYSSRCSLLELKQVKIDSNFSGNGSSRYYGIGAYLYDTKCQFGNVLISRNRIGTGYSWAKGSGVYYEGENGSTSEFNHVTIANNTIENDREYNGRGVFLDNGRLTIQNSIVYNPGPGSDIIISSGASSLFVNHSNISEGILGTGNIYVNPLFLDTIDFRLSSQSTCLGAGINTNGLAVDLENNPRPLPSNTMPDMGCYEIDQITGINSNEKKINSLHLYPNPVKKGQDFILEGNSLSEFKIIDVNGKEIYLVPKVLTNEQITYNSAALQTGIYLLFEKSTFISKLIVFE